MKSLLSTLAVISLTTPSVSSLISQNTNNDYQLSQTLEHYWYSSEKELEVNFEWKRPFDLKSFLYEIDIGKNEVSNYKKITVIDSNNISYTKISWGNDAYYGDAFRIVKNWNLSVLFSPKKITTLADIVSYSKYFFLKVNTRSSAATLSASQKLGFSYYSENGNNYIQFFGYVSVKTTWSMSNGAIWLNFGQGFRLHS